jgi:hypothetical protein
MRVGIFILCTGTCKTLCPVFPDDGTLALMRVGIFILCTGTCKTLCPVFPDDGTLALMRVGIFSRLMRMFWLL